jgi:putative membrane protein
VPDPHGTWQQSHWAFIAIGALRNIRGWIVPLGVVIVSQGMRGGVANLVSLAITLTVFVLAMVASLVEWLNYRYRLTDREIIIKHGIIARQERVIPYERIQSVDLSEAPLERLFQVVRLHIQTGAGGRQDAEAELKAIRRDDATALRSTILTARQRLRGGAAASAIEPTPESPTAPVPVAAAGEGELVRAFSTRDLLIAGATSGRIGAAAAIVGAALQFGENLVPDSVWRRVPWDGVADAATSVQVVGVLVVGFAIVAWLLSIASTALTFGGFAIHRLDDQIQVQYGLLDRKRTTVPVARIQAIRVDESLLRQPFGFAELRFESAGFGGVAGESGILFPLIPRREINAFLEAVAPAFAHLPPSTELTTLPERARRRYIVAACIGWIVLVAIAVAVAWRWLDIPLWWPLLLLIALPGFAWFGNLRFVDAGWRLEDGHLAMRWRNVGRVTMLTEARRLQYRRVTANLLQRRTGLASFHTAVASGRLGNEYALVHLDRAQADALLARPESSRPMRTELVRRRPAVGDAGTAGTA